MSRKTTRLCLVLVFLLLFALGCPANAAVGEWTDLGIYGGGGPVMVQDVAMQAIDGIPYAAYTDDQNNVLVKKYDAGAWTTLAEFTDGNGASYGVMGIAMGSSGSTLYLAYTSGNGYIMVKSLDTGTPEAPWTQLSNNELANAYYIDMYADAGTLYMGTRGTAAMAAIYDGSAWDVTTLAAHSQNGTVPITVLDGTPYAAYYDNANFVTFLAKYENGAWVNVEESYGLGIALDLVSLDGKLIYLYMYYIDDTIRYLTYVDQIDPANGYSASRMAGANGDIYDGALWDADLLVDNGIVYGCYIPAYGSGSTPDDKIRLKKFTGSEWEQVGPAIAKPAFYVSSAVSNGDFFVAFNNYAPLPDNEYMAAMAQVITPAPPATAPVITLQPVDQSVTEGLQVTFSAEASGSPAPTVQWQVSTDGGTSWSDIADATAATLSFTAALADSGNRYQALFTNTEGTATSASAILTVHSASSGWTDLGTYGGGDPFGVDATAIKIIGSTPYAAYSDDSGNVVVKKYDAGAWTSVAAFTDGNGVSTSLVNVDLGANGSTLYLAYSASSGYTLVRSLDTSTPGADWTQLSTTEVPAAYFLDMFVDGTNIYLGLQSNSASVAVFDGSAWTVNTLASQSYNGMVSVTVLNGTPYAAYNDNSDYKIHLEKYEGGVWSDVEFISESEAPHGLTSLDGKLVLLTTVYDYDLGYRFLHADLIDPANGFKVVPLTGISSDIYDGETAESNLLADNGTVYVSYTPGGTGSTPDGKVRLKYFTGAEWKQVGSEMDYVAYGISMTVASGEIYLSFINNDNSSARVQKITGADPEAPTVAMQPADQTVTESLTAEFTAAAGGLPMPSVQWQKSLDDGSTWTNIQGATTGTLSFTTALADSGTQYRAFFTNTEGSTTSAAALLTVTAYAAAPVITQEPSNQTVTEGQTAEFSAAASGAPTPTVQWQVSTDGGSTWSDIADATATTLSFTAALTDGGKRYRAVFTNSEGYATSAAAELTVNPQGVAPQITLHPVSQVVTAGLTAKFTAAATGTPTPTVQWQVSTDSGSTWSDLSGATETTLSFTAALTDSGNQYRAAFNNTTGGANTYAATLTVTPPGTAPVITLNPDDQTVTEGQNVQFTAAASGTPTPMVQWQVNTGGDWSDISGATSTTLSFKALLADSGNQYRAVFTNSLGSATTAAATLTVNPIPTYQVTVIPNNEAWGTVSGGGDYAAGENVVVSAAAFDGFSFVAWQEEGTVVSTSATYRFKMKASNRTLTAIFQPSWPGSVRLSGTALSTASIRLSLSKAVEGADSYVIYYGSERIVKAAGDGITWTIDGLTKATTYTFTVQAIYNGWPETTNGPSIRVKTKNK